jgi:hypothetical protein
MSGKVREGCRNDHLFSELLRRARRYGCDGLGHMKEVAHALNERDNDPPLSWAEVEKTAKSAWEIHDRGDNWVGREPRLVVAKPDFLALLDHPEALALWMYLRFSHQGLQGSRMRNHELNGMRDSKTEHPCRRSKVSKSALNKASLFRLAVYIIG